MSGAAGSGGLWFRVFKYTIYCLLALNVFLFFQDDLAASAELFRDGLTWRNVIEGYSATIDTFAWVILLLLFELETAVISDEKLRGSLKWVFSGVRAICYFFIVYSFYGYLTKYGLVNNLAPFTVADVCALVGTDYTYVDLLDEYLPLTPEVCVQMQGQPLLQIDGTNVIGTREQLALAQRLAATDVINSGTWLLVVASLEAEVWLQLRGRLTDGILRVNKYVKAVLYAILFLCAVYWGIDGDFLDFWDAFLWLVAFVFIELNIFEWHEETKEAPAAAAA